MSDMSSIPGTPSWVQSGAKSTTTEPVAQPAAQTQPEENKETTQTTE